MTSLYAEISGPRNVLPFRSANAHIVPISPSDSARKFTCIICIFLYNLLIKRCILFYFSRYSFSIEWSGHHGTSVQGAHHSVAVRWSLDTGDDNGYTRLNNKWIGRWQLRPNYRWNNNLDCERQSTLESMSPKWEMAGNQCRPGLSLFWRISPGIELQQTIIVHSLF